MNEDALVPELPAVRHRDRWRVDCDQCLGPHYHRTLGWVQAR